MNPAPVVHSTAVIDDGCPIACHVSCQAEVEFSCGGPHGVLKLTFQPEALREFQRLAGEALTKIDERFDAIQAQAV